MDVIEAIITAIWYRLTGDVTLAGWMHNAERPAGEAWLHYPGAPENATFPYITHRIRASPQEIVVGRGTYELHVWDRSTSALKVHRAKARVSALLEGRVWNVIESQYGYPMLYLPAVIDSQVIVHGLRFRLGPEELMPDPDPGVKHYVVLFEARWVRTADLRSMIETP